MHRLSKKLNSQSGASMLIALVLLLVCVMVGSVILSSATGNADKLKKRRAEQQEYLAVRSAAELLRASLGGTVYAAWENYSVYDCYGCYEPMRPEKHTDVANVCEKLDYELAGDAGLKAELADLVYTAYRSHTKYYPPTPAPAQIEREFLLSSAEVELPQVKARLTFDTESYGAIFRLTIAENAVSDYAMTLRLQPTVISPEKGSAEEIKEVLSNADQAHEVLETFVNDDGTTENRWVRRDFDITVYTLQTTVTYDSGKITKGVTADV